MMRVVPAHNIIDIKDESHYTIDVSKLLTSTAVICPFDKDMKVGRDETGAVCIAKKSWVRPFLKKITCL